MCPCVLGACSPVFTETRGKLCPIENPHINSKMIGAWVIPAPEADPIVSRPHLSMSSVFQYREALVVGANYRPFPWGRRRSDGLPADDRVPRRVSSTSHGAGNRQTVQCETQGKGLRRPLPLLGGYGHFTEDCSGQRRGRKEEDSFKNNSESFFSLLKIVCPNFFAYSWCICFRGLPVCLCQALQCHIVLFW